MTSKEARLISDTHHIEKCQEVFKAIKMAATNGQYFTYLGIEYMDGDTMKYLQDLGYGVYREDSGVYEISWGKSSVTPPPAQDSPAIHRRT